MLPIDQDAWAVAYAPGRALVAEPDPFVHNLLVVRELRFADRSNRVVAEIPLSDDTITRVEPRRQHERLSDGAAR